MGAVPFKGDGFKKAIEAMEPIDVGEVIDLSGLSDLLDSISGVENYADRKQLTDEAIKIAQQQTKLMQAEERNLNTRAALVAKELANIQMLTGEQSNVIEIDAHGVEKQDCEGSTECQAFELDCE